MNNYYNAVEMAMRRYQRIVVALRYIGFTETEAKHTVRLHREKKFDSCSEIVWACYKNDTRKAINHALRSRHYYLRLYGDYAYGTTK